MSQCLNVSCLAACLRERVSRAPAQPGYRTLARAARLGETHPGIRSPVARPKIRIPAPQRPRGVWFFGLRGGKQFAPRAGQCFGCERAAALLLPLLLLGVQRRWLELGTLRLGDGPLLPAGARNTVRVAAWRGPASSVCARGAAAACSLNMRPARAPCLLEACLSYPAVLR